MRPMLALLMSLMALVMPPLTLADEPQRRVSPVRPETNVTRQPGKDVDDKVVERYLQGDTLSALAEARRDSLRKIYTRYPRLTALALGVNVGDLLMAAFGQDYTSIDINAQLNLWNRLQPILSVGMGRAKSTPDDANYTYHGKWSPYISLGADYNFLFKSSPDYNLLLGVRAGYSNFGYDITDIAINNGYWGEHPVVNIEGERSHALWGEIALGLRVKLVKRWSLGWTVRYHWLFNYGKNEHSKPWYIPGYGARGNRLAVSLTLSYVLPFYHPTPPPKQ